VLGGTDSRFDDQEFVRLIRKLNVSYRVHKTPEF
jgi:hypothetical protein